MRSDGGPAVTLVNSNVLLDIFTDDPEWSEWSTQTLGRVLDQGEVVVNPLVYAEVSAFRREPLPYSAGFLAGKAFVSYRLRGGMKSAPLPDFYIGAHAAVAGYRLLTRDAPRYRTYFPRLELLSPAEG